MTNVRHDLIVPEDNFWVFGYGSLMWNPGFKFIQSVIGKAYGYHRCFCLRSRLYRGTKETPGLVLGLDRGGSCQGRAFEVSACQATEVIDYLFEREMLRNSYHPKWISIKTETQSNLQALSFVINRRAADYAPKLTEVEQAQTIIQAAGARGSNYEYLENTLNYLQALSITDRKLIKIHKMAKRQKASSTFSQ
jgi:cation transport protein ChaC